MRIAAIGDAHLGRSYASPITPEGISTRERDFEISFEAAVDLALKQEPELVIWLGDVFDHPRPTYRSFRFAQRALAKIRDHGVDVVIISGNHDTPRLPGTGSPYSALADAFPGFHFAHRLQYERFELAGLVVHAVPQMMAVEHALEALAEADRRRSADKTNLLVTHPRLRQVVPKYSDVNEIEVDAGELKADLVLLGHFHTFSPVLEHMWYAGSTDTFSFADDPDVAKGIVVLDTDTGVCRHVPLVGQRRLVTLPSLYAEGLSPAELTEAVIERVSGLPEGSLGRLYLELVDPEAYRLLDIQSVREAHAHALTCKLEPNFVGVVNQVGGTELDSLPSRWSRFVEGQDLGSFDRQLIERLGREYIEQAVERAP